MKLCLAAALLVWFGLGLGQFVPEPPCICLDELLGARGLRNPLSMRHAGDGTGRRFVAEQIGLVWIFDEEGVRSSQPFLNLTHVVISSGNWGDHRGFLQMAFHPNYRENGKLYCYFILEDPDGNPYSRLNEMRVREDNPNEVNYTSDRELLLFRQPHQDHNGGDIHFGIDGYLYLSLGDGGGAGGDPYDLALNKSVPYGKIIRIDVNSQADGKPYRVPDDNPYLDDPAAMPEVYAIGFRNPWRNDVDEGDRFTGEGRGRHFIADVGEDWMEEVDILERGGNFAWSAREGYECFKQHLCGRIGPEVWPIHAYNHTVGSAIIGGHVYRGCQSPGLNGLYFFADFMSGKLFRLRQEGNTWVDRQLFTCGVQECDRMGFTGIDHENDDFGQILSFGEDEGGEEYYLMTDFASPTNPEGRVFKMVDPFNQYPPCTPN